MSLDLAIRCAMKARSDAIEECAKIAEHLNGWGNPPAPELAAQIAKVIRDLVGEVKES